MEMEDPDHICLFCKLSLETIPKVNIKLNTTEGRFGRNLEEFIKKWILEDANLKFSTSFLCLSCFKLINELEGYILKACKIQDLLVQQYSSQEANPVDTILLPDLTEVKIEYVDKDPNDDVVIENNETEEELSDKSDEEFRPNKKRVRKTRSRAQSTTKTKAKQEGKGEKTEKQSTSQKSEAELSGYFCKICGKHYTKYSAFMKHRLAHRNANKFKCKLCDKTFSWKSCLHKHMKIHEGIPSYHCELCGKAFFYYNTHKVHMATHTGTRDYKCDECGLDFVLKSGLKKHLMVHTQEKYWVCPECGKTLSQESSFRRHMRTLHNIDMPNAYRLVLPKADLAKKKRKEREMEGNHGTKQTKEEIEVQTAADSITA